MNAITKLTAAALGAMSIAGGVALAQTAGPNDNPNDGRADTANYGTPPGAPLKRDGSLSADPVVTTPAASSMNDTSSTTSTTTTSTTNWNNPPADTAAPVAAAPAQDSTMTDNTSTADTTPAPRADRN